ncbi:hypothetical protein C7999DRAFT_44550 [Corynascus novoguineensis]|uniref:Zn(2)-C6 fungal-type domain-containing protein n=1 Tax=Corynascus novoguineensis TaxID=1126955 RepID=A0AAN7HIV6_9PEZI|nr:hypothetical protein C7999DRAFT_44550 [Corynascus novoguineensis]
MRRDSVAVKEYFETRRIFEQNSQTSAILPDLRRKVASAASRRIIRSEAARPMRTNAPTHSLFTTDAAAAAVAAAHHGLQALQAAVAAPAPVPSTGTISSQQHASIADASYLTGTNVGQPTAAGANSKANTNSKATRLRRACDMCSQRKVKVCTNVPVYVRACDETQPCRPCTDLGVDCTFNRTMKRRGPPNKHAEAAKAAKQQRLEPNISPGPHNAAETLISISGTQDAQHILDAESIAPWPVLTLLIDDFFTYIHPLTPFPHEPTFRMSFSAREDRTNRGFLALLASMIGCLVASYPRTARLHLKTEQHSMHMYPKAINLIERCRTVALEARGASFYSRDDITVYDAATSYFIGLAAAYTMQWKICRRFMAESMAFIRELGYHKPRDLGSSMFGVTYRGPPFNHVEDQLGKRIFWCLFLGLRSMYQLGTHHSDVVLPPPTPSEPYPDLPVEVDDQYILTHQILGQPEHTVSLLTGFNHCIKIYMTMNGLVSVDLSYIISTLSFHDHKVMLDESLQAVKQILDGLPRELTIDLDGGSNNKPSHNLSNIMPTVAQTGVFDDGTGALHYCPIPYATLPPQQQQQKATSDFRHKPSPQLERRRLLQYEIQKANIYASQISTRSYYVERYLNLRDAHREHARSQAAQAAFGTTQQQQPPNGSDAGGGSVGDATGNANGSVANKSVAAAALQAVASEQADPIDANMEAERELIVQHLLTVLASIPQRSMEPNGASLINKIRQVASTLVHDGGAPEQQRASAKPPSAAAAAASKAQESLSKFVEILMRLERIPPGVDLVSGVGGAGLVGLGAGEDEEQELRTWADLREHQVRFLQGGGFMGLP